MLTRKLRSEDDAARAENCQVRVRLRSSIVFKREAGVWARRGRDDRHKNHRRPEGRIQ